MSETFVMSPDAYLAINEGCSDVFQVATTLLKQTDFERRWQLLRLLRNQLTLLELERFARHESLDSLLQLPDKKEPAE